MPTEGRRACPRRRRNGFPETRSPALVDSTARGLIDADGLDVVTMPRLAKHLGVGTMSLYRHVDDKNDLIDAVGNEYSVTCKSPTGRRTTRKAASSATSEP